MFFNGPDRIVSYSPPQCDILISPVIDGQLHNTFISR